MSDEPEITLKEITPQELTNAVVEEITSDPYKWVALGLTKTEWVKKLNGGRYPTYEEGCRWPLEQGVLVHYEGKGVYVTGMCGNFYLGKRLLDGRVDRSGADFGNTNKEDDVIIEYADPPNYDLSRDEDGALIYPPKDDPWWNF